MKTKPAQVVMLPTKKSRLNINFDDTLSYSNAGGLYVDTGNKSHKPQHLYFISTDPNEEIKEGDWIIKIGEFVKRAGKSEIDYLKIDKNYFHKIIASTDPSLGLPAIPLTWIRDVYVPSNGSIKEVKLELEFNHALKSMATESRIKLTPNNEVVIIDGAMDIFEKVVDGYVSHEEGLKQLKQMETEQELEDAANDYITGEEKQSFALTPILRVVKHAFKAGANWQKEQSATDAIEFMQFRDKNCHKFYDKWRLNYSIVNEYTITELYELWQQTRNK